MTRQGFLGNTLVEYTFAGVLVLVVGIAAMQLLGGNFNAVLAALLGDMQGSRGAAALNQSGPKVSINPNDFPPALRDKVQDLMSKYPDRGVVCYEQSNLCIPVEPSTTTGGLGGGKILAGMESLLELAQQLQEQNADPTLVGMVTQLASKGHDIGGYFDEMQAALAEAKKQCGSVQCSSDQLPASFFNKYAGFEGKQRNLASQFWSSWIAVQAYIDENPQVLANFPAVGEIIDQESQRIVDITNSASYDFSWDTSTGVKKTGVRKVIQSVTTYPGPSGKTITQTSYINPGNGRVIYQTVDNGSTVKAYKFMQDADSSVFRMVLTTADPPPPEMEVTFMSYSSYDFDTTPINPALDVHQSANDICGSAGDVDQCVVDLGDGDGSTPPTS